MSTTIAFALIAHVLVGIIGVAASYMVLHGLLKRTLSISFLRGASLTAFLAYLISWFTGGFYYVVWYGGQVKPVIKAGAYPWAHSLITETKEHAFLFLPVLSFVLVLVIYSRGAQLSEWSPFKKAVVGVALVTTVVGILIALAGIIMSGSVR